MAPETISAIEHNIFTPGNYFYNGVGHVTVKYDEVLAIGFSGIEKKAKEALAKLSKTDADYISRSAFLESVIETTKAAVTYARRYADLAEKMAAECNDSKRKEELLQIARNCRRVPAKQDSAALIKIVPEGRGKKRLDKTVFLKLFFRHRAGRAAR